MRNIQPIRRLLAVVAGIALAATAISVASASPAFAGAPATTVSANYTSQCGEPPVPDTPVNDGPEGMFGTPCYHHDRCYSWGTTHDRATCDWIFYTEMVNACHSHYGWWDPRQGWCDDLAAGYYVAVRGFGRYYYQGPSNWNN